jgi:PPOX class probable F420-dependent enzyme
VPASPSEQEGARLSTAQRRFLIDARRAILATIDDRGWPRPVPICYVLVEEDRQVLWTPIDEKPKLISDPMRLARIRDIMSRPDVALLVDRGSEDWSELAWLRLHGRARVLPAPPSDVLEALRAKYSQYRDQRLEARPIIRIELERATGRRRLA